MAEQEAIYKGKLYCNAAKIGNGFTVDLAGNVVATSVTANIVAAPGSIGATELASDAVETLKIKDLNVTTGKLAANAVTSAKIDTGVIQTSTVTLTAAQVKTLYSANTNKGVEILAAPAAGYAIEFISAVLRYNYDGTNAYTAANGLTFNVGSTAVSDTIAAAFLQATADTVAICQVLSAEVIAASTALAATALYLQEGTADPTGSGVQADTLKVTVAYRLHNVAV